LTIVQYDVDWERQTSVLLKALDATHMMMFSKKSPMSPELKASCPMLPFLWWAVVVVTTTRTIKSAATRSEMHAIKAILAPLLIPPALDGRGLPSHHSRPPIPSPCSNCHRFKQIDKQQGIVSHQGFQQSTNSNANLAAFQAIDLEVDIHDLTGSSICLRNTRLVSANRDL
jgi:hypothetical protein